MNVPTVALSVPLLPATGPARPAPLHLAGLVPYAAAPQLRGANDGGPPHPPSRPRRELRGRYAAQVVYPSMLWVR